MSPTLPVVRVNFPLVPQPSTLVATQQRPHTMPSGNTYFTLGDNFSYWLKKSLLILREVPKSEAPQAAKTKCLHSYLRGRSAGRPRPRNRRSDSKTDIQLALAAARKRSSDAVKKCPMTWLSNSMRYAPGLPGKDGHLTARSRPTRQSDAAKTSQVRLYSLAVLHTFRDI